MTLTSTKGRKYAYLKGKFIEISHVTVNISGQSKVMDLFKRSPQAEGNATKISSKKIAACITAM